MCDEVKPQSGDEIPKQPKARQCRSQHIEAKELLRKRPNQPGKCGEVAADASLSFKNTMPPGFTMIFGWP
jgi:hypothetical protein